VAPQPRPPALRRDGSKVSPCSPGASPAASTPLRHLGEVLDLQHVVVGVATQDAVPLVGHIDIVLDGFGGDGQPPAGGHAGQGGDAGSRLPAALPGTGSSHRSGTLSQPVPTAEPFPAANLPLAPRPHSLGLPEEVVLAHDGDEEADEAFNCHGNKPPRHDVPFEG